MKIHLYYVYIYVSGEIIAVYYIMTIKIPTPLRVLRWGFVFIENPKVKENLKRYNVKIKLFQI